MVGKKRAVSFSQPGWNTGKIDSGNYPTKILRFARIGKEPFTGCGTRSTAEPRFNRYKQSACWSVCTLLTFGRVFCLFGVFACKKLCQIVRKSAWECSRFDACFCYVFYTERKCTVFEQQKRNVRFSECEYSPLWWDHFHRSHSVANNFPCVNLMESMMKFHPQKR